MSDNFTANQQNAFTNVANSISNKISDFKHNYSSEIAYVAVGALSYVYPPIVALPLFCLFTQASGTQDFVKGSAVGFVFAALVAKGAVGFVAAHPVIAVALTAGLYAMYNTEKAEALNLEHDNTFNIQFSGSAESLSLDYNDLIV
jgi:hypothetical protein